MSRFWFLSRFCLNGEGRKKEDFESLEMQCKTIALKKMLLQAEQMSVAQLVTTVISSHLEVSCMLNGTTPKIQCRK